MKEIIDVLKTQPCSKKDLEDTLMKHSSNKSQEASRKKCERSLKKLESWGLVQKCDDHYR
jgi:hypothetical protein